MQLVIYGEEDNAKLITQFATYMLPRLREWLYTGAKNVEDRYDKLQEALEFQGYTTDAMSLYGLVVTAIQSLIVQQVKNDAIICIDPNARMGRVNLDRMMRALEYGALGQPILVFRTVFDEISNKQDELYNAWLQEQARLVGEDVFI